MYLCSIRIPAMLHWLFPHERMPVYLVRKEWSRSNRQIVLYENPDVEYQLPCWQTPGCGKPGNLLILSQRTLLSAIRRISVISSIAYFSPSRPNPDSLTPP